MIIKKKKEILPIFQKTFDSKKIKSRYKFLNQPNTINFLAFLFLTSTFRLISFDHCPQKLNRRVFGTFKRLWVTFVR